jgi:cysteine-rich repeat protein
MTKTIAERRALQAALACGLIAAVATAAVAAAPPEASCSAAKRKASAAKEKGKLACYSKAAAKSLQVDSACLMKAETKFSAAITKANAKGCADPGNGLSDPASAMESSIDACVQHIVDALPDPGKCSASKFKAAGADAAGELLCYSKASAKQVQVDTACTTKATAKLGPAFTKADSGKTGACTGAAVAVQAAIDGSCVLPIANLLPPKPPGCGNGVVEPGLGENCDDGNTTDQDACPPSCHIDPCTPVTGTTGISLHFTASGAIGGLGIVLDYPEGKVADPAASYPQAGVSGSLADYGYEAADNVIKFPGTITPNPAAFETISFARVCQGASAAVAADFTCAVTDASDGGGNPVDPTTVTCTVTIP